MSPPARGGAPAAADAPGEPAVIGNDELRDVLRTLFGELPMPRLAVDNTALLCVDIQYLCAHPERGLGAKARREGVHHRLESYWRALRDEVLPNVRRLQDVARARGVQVIHVRVAAYTADGRDTTRRYASMGLRTPRDSEEAAILPEVAPRGDELVVNKLTSSAFNSTNIERLLRNMCIENLVVVGVVTNGCVESTVRSAAELDFGTIVVTDATAAMAPQLHEHSLLSMGYKDAVLRTTDEMVRLLESL